MTETPLDELDEIATPDQWHEIVSRQPTETPEQPGASPSTRRRIVAGVVAMAIAVVMVAVLVVAFRTGEGPGPARETSPPPPSYSTREIRLTPGSAEIVVGEGAVWVAEPNAVVAIDPTTGQVLHEFDVAGVSEFSSFAVGGGAVWVTAHDSKYAGPTPDVVRIDPGTGSVADRAIFSSDLSAIAFSEGDLVYGAAGEGIALIGRYDPTTGAFRDQTGAGGEGPPSTIVAAGDSFWVGDSDYSRDALTRVPTDFSDTKPIHGITSVGSMATAGGYLWVQNDALYQVDPATGDIVSVRDFPRLGAVASDGTQLWVLSHTGSKNPSTFVPDPNKPATVSRLDPETGEPIGGPVELEHVSPANLAVGAGGAWVSFYDDGVVVNVLPGDPRPTDSGTVAPSSCDLPAIAPTTLPWLDQGAAVPEPDVIKPYKKLLWLGPEGTEWEGSNVSMRLLEKPVSGDGDAAPQLPDGTPGVIVPFNGAWDIFWRESSTYCGTIALYVYLDNLSAAESRAKTIEMADSLG